MNAKLSIGLLAMLGVPVLLASALAQQQGNNQVVSNVQEPVLPELVKTPASNGSGSLGVITEIPARIPPNVDSQISVFNQGDQDVLPTYTQSANAHVSAMDSETLFAHRADELAKKFGEAKSEADRSQVKTELSELLEKHFGLRQKRHQEEIAGLEAKVKKLKELLEKRQENRREIIAKRLDQILSNAEGLGW